MEAKTVKGFDVAKDAPNYYVRLGSLSTKLRKRAYHKALAQVKDTKQRSQESISQLNHTVDLVSDIKLWKSRTFLVHRMWTFSEDEEMTFLSND